MARGYIATSSGGVTSDETTVTKDKVLIGETYLGADTDDEVGTGTMPNNGAINGTLNAGQSKNIPAGYTSGGTITANSLASQTSANATAAYILNPYTAWVNGSRLTGSMTNYSGKTSTSNYVSSNFRSGTTNYIFASPGATGYFTSGTYLRIPATNLAAGNIKKGVQIMGITGTFEGYSASNNQLYNRGAFGSGYNINSFKAYMTGDEGSILTAETGQIKVYMTGEVLSLSYHFHGGLKSSTNTLINYSAYNTLYITFSYSYAESDSNEYSDTTYLDLTALNSSGGKISSTRYVEVLPGYTRRWEQGATEKTVFTNISSYNGMGGFSIDLYANRRWRSGGTSSYHSYNHTAYVQRIYLT